MRGKIKRRILKIRRPRELLALDFGAASQHRRGYDRTLYIRPPSWAVHAAGGRR